MAAFSLSTIAAVRGYHVRLRIVGNQALVTRNWKSDEELEDG